jgi:hypothetical protein
MLCGRAVIVGQNDGGNREGRMEHENSFKSSRNNSSLCKAAVAAPPWLN